MRPPFIGWWPPHPSLRAHWADRMRYRCQAKFAVALDLGKAQSGRAYLCDPQPLILAAATTALLREWHAVTSFHKCVSFDLNSASAGNNPHACLSPEAAAFLDILLMTAHADEQLGRD